MGNSLHGVVVVSFAALAGVSFAALAGVGCSSTLDEFLCTEASDCSDNPASMGARCEPSGHCSFVDTTCSDSGFRFGQSSGAESGECVADTGGTEPDAGTPLGAAPIARITSIVPGNCNTSVAVDGSESAAFDGATIQTYTWTLFNAADEEIDTFTGAGDTPLVRGLHGLGGNYLAPSFNLPSYDGFGALRAVFDGSVRSSSIEQSGLDLQNVDYHLFFAAASVASEAPEEAVVRILGSDDEELFRQSLALGEDTFLGHQVGVVFSAEATMESLSGARLLFGFDGNGERWLDNVALVETASGEVVTQNPSIEMGVASPWIYNAGGLSGGLQSRAIEGDMREEENYSVALKVTDSNGQESLTAEIDVVGEPCLAPF